MERFNIMNSRIPLYVNFYKKVIRSRLRLFLTLSGMVLSVVILLIGIAFSETYFFSKYSEIDLYKQLKVSVVSGNYNYDLYRSILDLEDYSSTLELISPYIYPIFHGEYNGKQVEINVRDIRTNNINLHLLLNGTDPLSRYSGKLLHGRLLDEKDIEQKANVAIIDEALSDLLFGLSNGVGEKINIPVYQLNYQTGMMEISYYEELLIVGILSASPTQRDDISQKLTSDNTTAVIESNVYTPLSLTIAEKNTESYDMTVLTYSSNKQAYYNSLSIISKKIYESDSQTYYSVENYYTLGTRINNLVSSTKSSLVTILLFLFIASGLLIANTMFFSVKERINEIGIRKAIGAFDSDIVKQFVFEGFIYGVISACVGIILGVFIGSGIYIFLDLKSTWNVYLIFSPSAIILCFIVPVIVGTISSVLPAIYASKIKITDAIKSE